MIPPIMSDIFFKTLFVRILGLSGGARPSSTPTEPYVTLSRHTALVAEPFSFYRPGVSIQTASDTHCGYASTTGMHGQTSLFVFAGNQLGQMQVNLSHHWIRHRLVETPIVGYPPLQNWIDSTRHFSHGNKSAFAVQQ